LSTPIQKINMKPEEVKAFRDKFQFTVHSLGEWLGVTWQAVKLWEEGKRGVPETTARLFKLVDKYPQLKGEFYGN